jgi:hypothetical protein
MNLREWAPIVLGTLMLLPSGAGCGSAEESDTTSAVDPGAIMTEEPAGFRTWFEEQCPSGQGLRVMNNETGEVLALSCVEARAAILENDEVRAQAIHRYQEALQTSTPSWGGEPMGEAKQKFSPVGAACSLVTLGLGLIFNWPGGKHGCDDPNASNPGACRAVTAGSSIGLGIACWFI